MKRLLLVEDEDIILKALKRLLERNRYEVHCAGSVQEALTYKLHSFDLILADLRLPGDLGTALIAPADPIPVVIMTSHASVRSAVDAMRHGAIDYIAKPFDHDELLIVIQRSLHQNLIHAQNRALKLDVHRQHPLEHYVYGTGFSSIQERITQESKKQRFVYLHGERGTERESVAKAIHCLGTDSDGPLLVLDASEDHHEMGTLLFGLSPQSDPAITPPTKLNFDLPNGGYLQAAQNGTLVIRNPELLTLEAQQLLYKAVAVGIPVSLGKISSGTKHVQLICISENGLQSSIDANRLIPEFSDLFADSEFEIPPLRARPDDISTLAKRHLLRLEQRYGWNTFKINEDAMAALKANPWLGNVAELESVINHAVFTCRTQTLTLNDLGLCADIAEGINEGRDLNLDEYFRYFVIRNQTKLSETELASRLGISRKALWERRQKMQLLRDKVDGNLG